MKYRYKIVKSHDHEDLDSNCSIVFSSNAFRRSVVLSYCTRDGRRDRSNVLIKLDRDLFEIKDKGDKANEYIFHCMNLILKEIGNKFHRTEFVFNFLRDYCKSNVFNVGDSQFLRIGNDHSWALLVREPWSENELMTIEEAMTKNMSFVRNESTSMSFSGKKYTKKFIYYNKDIGHVQKPDGWDFVESGNAAITRRLKKLGPVWDIVEFKSVYKYDSIDRSTSTKSASKSPSPWLLIGVSRTGRSTYMFPQKVGYMAPRENVVAARNYFEKNKARLRKEKIMRHINGELKMPLYMRRDFEKEKMDLSDKQKELLRGIVNEAKAKF